MVRKINMADKIYVANGKRKTFDNGSSIVKFALNLRDLKQAKEYVYELNGVKYINLEIGEKKISPDQWGKTHYVSVDTFKPEPKKQSEAPVNKQDEIEDDIPF